MANSAFLRANKNQHSIKNSKSKKMDDGISNENRFWKCPCCGNDGKLQAWSYDDMATRGGPVCQSCDSDMILIPTSK